MSDLGSLILEFLLAAPFSVPYQLLEPGRGPACGWSFARAPFAHTSDGYLEPAPCAAVAASEGSETWPRRIPGSRQFAGQASLEGLTAIDGSYGRAGGRARFLTAFRLEADAAFVGYFAPQGQASAGWLGQTHVDVRFAQDERLQFRAGMGVRERFVGGGVSVGFDALYAVDVLWPRPVATTLEISGGSLGVNGWAVEVRSTVGYVVGVVEVYAGWDAVWLGAPQTQAEYLGGLVLGERAYF
jgi:hypothetical protein